MPRAFAFLVASIVFSCLIVPASAVDLAPLSPMALRDTRGEMIEAAPAKWTVYCFLGTECPLAKLYGPRLQELADKYASDGVAFIGVNSNVQDSAEEIDAYAAMHSIRFPIARDSDQSVADQLSAKRTPEVVLLDSIGRVRYRGRIDDQYEPGIARKSPRRHDLRDAIDELIAGKPVSNPVTPGVGCLITRIVKPVDNKDAESTITFNRDIAPILNAHCVECHREGEIAPFALTDYSEVVGWGEMMIEVIDQSRMPPWHADPSVGKFKGERKLSRQHRDTLATWVDEGMPEGDPDDLPDRPKWASGWHLPTPPDVEIPMRTRDFLVPNDGTVEYQYFVVDPKWTEDRWVRAAQVIPGNSSVVHHSIVFVRPPDGSDSNGIGMMGAYVPGQRTGLLPPGHARRVPAGSKLVFQMHYTPNGIETPDRTRVGVWFADDESVTHEVATWIAINHQFEIPPNDPGYQVNMNLNGFPKHGKLLGVSPHMHLRGKSFALTANRTAGESEPLLSVPQYDFNWQHWYSFADPIDLGDVKSLSMRVTFDNSPDNPANPAPEEYVSWGDQTWEEMAIAFFDVASPIGEASSRKGRRTVNRIIPSEAAIAARADRVNQAVDKFLKKLDANSDGVVRRDETPETFQRFGFREFDIDKDGMIDRSELTTRAEQRL